MPSSCLKSSPTPSHLPKPSMRKIIIFKTKPVVIENTLPNVSVKNMGLPSKENVLENFLKQSWSSSEVICWTVSQPHSPENHPVKFLSQPFSFFQKIHVMNTHLVSRLPHDGNKIKTQRKKVLKFFQKILFSQEPMQTHINIKR